MSRYYNAFSGFLRGKKYSEYVVWIKSVCLEGWEEEIPGEIEGERLHLYLEGAGKGAKLRRNDAEDYVESTICVARS